MRTDQLIDAFVRKLKSSGVPVFATNNSSLLSSLEQSLPKPLPQSLEQLLSSYSFPAFDVNGISLFAWSQGQEMNDYFFAASAAKGSLSELLLPAGYFQIGRPDTADFDAICIDLNGNARNRENRIVRADHEEILCNWRVTLTAELCPSFQSFVSRVIEDENASIYYAGE